MSVGVLAIGPHPDDVELGIGGLVAKLAAQGHEVVMLDLTEGELSSRGTVEERRGEAGEAARILGVAQRDNLGLRDGAVADTPEQRKALVPYLRRRQPRIILAPMCNDRHPDHNAAHLLVKHANQLAGVAKYDPDTAADRWRAERVYYYAAYGDPREPDLIVDVTEYFETKASALRAHASQFHNPEYEGAATSVSSERFWEAMRARAVYWGARIGAGQANAQGVHLAECLYHEGPVPVAGLPGLEGETA